MYRAVAVVILLLACFVQHVEAGKVMQNLMGRILYIRHGTPESYIMRILLPAQTIEKVLKIDARDDAKILAYYTSSQTGRKVISTFSILQSDNIIELKKDMSLGKAFNINGRSPALSPDGRTLAYLSLPENHMQSENRVADWYLYLISMDGGSSRQLLKRSCYQMKPTWFPDGKRLAFASKDLSIYTVDSTTGEEEKIIDFGIGPVVSPDGTKIAYLSKDIDQSIKDQMIAFQKLTIKQYYNEYQKNKTQREMLEFSRNFTSYSIYLYDVKTKTSKKITKEISIEDPVVWSPDSRYITYNNRTYFNYEFIYVLDPNTGTIEKIENAKGRVMAWEK